MSYKLTREFLEKALADGETPDSLCSRLGCTRSTIYNNLRKHHLTTPSRDLSSGTVFGNLVVRTKVGSNGRDALYECDCHCGKRVVVPRGRLVTGNSKSCGCSHKRQGNANPNFIGHGEIGSKYWSQLKLRAKANGRSCDVTIEEGWSLYLKQNRLCALSGLPILFQRKAQTASLDRIDSSLGYSLDNVQWVHKDVNRMKQEFSQAYFTELCSLVVAQQRACDEPSTPTP